ncbi:hypothetical protein OSSY52_15120 [Tepiditoga spiralis]|uniref:Response regulatory domain-containing protein n=1 Tax=Tepiditoga spiralis TaxID=2108365 RepID=A0A7G1G4R3_9BACT|nr:response regulator [Tepiditoga spiralis]BBE31371.1 hypothetical protein OSSY52_15120 [Tepiditoga spiralis]
MNSEHVDILIIEENESIINLYKKMLMNILNDEYSIKILKNNKEISNFFDNTNNFKNKISLIISESSIEGVEIIEKLGDIKSMFPRVCVYIMSNDVNIEKLKKALKYGVSDWIEKPITPDEFYEVVHKSIYRGTSFESKIRDIEKEIDNFNVENEIEYYKLENRLGKLLGENPSRYETHYLLGKLYEKKGIKTLSIKHYKASEALKN